MQSIPGTTTPDGYPSSQKQPKPRPCAVVSCEEMALPGKSWCQAHTDLFIEIGRPSVPPEPPRSPSYLQNVVRKPGEEPPARSSTPVDDAPTPGGQRRGGGRPPKLTCDKPGCTEPRAVSEGGTRYRFCITHQRDAWRSRGEDRRREAGTKVGQRGRPRRQKEVQTAAEPVVVTDAPLPFDPINETAATVSAESSRPRRQIFIIGWVEV